MRHCLRCALCMHQWEPRSRCVRECSRRARSTTGRRTAGRVLHRPHPEQNDSGDQLRRLRISRYTQLRALRKATGPRDGVRRHSLSLSPDPFVRSSPSHDQRLHRAFHRDVPPPPLPAPAPHPPPSLHLCPPPLIAPALESQAAPWCWHLPVFLHLPHLPHLPHRPPQSRHLGPGHVADTDLRMDRERCRHLQLIHNVRDNGHADRGTSHAT